MIVFWNYVLDYGSMTVIVDQGLTIWKLSHFNTISIHERINNLDNSRCHWKLFPFWGVCQFSRT